MIRIVVAALAGLMAGGQALAADRPAAAAAPVAVVPTEPAGPDDAYGFLDGTGVGSAGDRSLTSETTARFGKFDGRYAGINSKIELGWTPVERLQLSLAVWAAYHHVQGNTVPGIPDVNRFAFDGLSAQARYMIRERGAAPFDPGFTVGLELVWGRYSEGFGVTAERFAAVLKFAADAALIGDRLYGAVNLNLGPATERPRGLPGYMNESGLELGGALAWRVSEQGSTFVGGNIRYVAAYGGAFFGEWGGHAVLVGPTFYHRFGEVGPLKDVFLSLAWNAQLWGRAAGAAGNLDLAGFERHQVRVKLGGAF